MTSRVILEGVRLVYCVQNAAILIKKLKLIFNFCLSTSLDFVHISIVSFSQGTFGEVAMAEKTILKRVSFALRTKYLRGYL